MRDDASISTLALCLLTLALLVGPVVGALGGDPGDPTDPEEPILRPDSQWVATDWGYQHQDLELPAEGDGVSKPTVFIMEGYSGAGTPNAYLEMWDGTLIALNIDMEEGPGGEYAEVHASIRGTECSGGQFMLYDRRHAHDGYNIIEWIAEQPWSNGNVGMIGWSYSGQTAFWTASTQPPSLKAVAPSLLHADIYRDIFMPGGVENYAFPVIWYLEGPDRAPTHALENGIIPNDEICTQNQADETGPGEPIPVNNLAIWAAVGETDNDWYQAHAAANWADEINVPYLQQTNWHDEQTGPRSVVLWNHVDPGPATYTDCRGQEVTVDSAKWIRMGNGDHGHGSYVSDIMWDWFDVWLKDEPDENCYLDDQVINYFEAGGNAVRDQEYTTVKSGDAWPFEDTQWTRFYTHPDGTLDKAAPTTDEGTDTYVSGIPAQNNAFYYSYDGGFNQESQVREHDTPTRLSYVTQPLAEDTTIAGPILFDMYASLVGTDTDFFVSISDVHPDGQVEYVQRGLLKASHNDWDPRRSWYNDAGELIQPYRPHTNPDPVLPDKVEHYPLEVWPTGHIFRDGHRIALEIHTPPVIDGLWGYTATEHDPAAVSLHHSPEMPTSLLLPLVEPDGPVGEDPDGCGVTDGFPCAPADALGLDLG